MTRTRGAVATALLLLMAALFLIVLGYRNATRLPLVRQLDLPLRTYPAGAAPIRLLLLSDLHVHGPGTTPDRLARVVQQVNALHADAVIITGDFVGGTDFGTRYSPAEAAAPLAHLRARYGIYAVLGNHDIVWGAAEVANALRRNGVKVLINNAVQVGPLALGGIDGRLLPTRKLREARRNAFYPRLERTPGVKIVAVHRPDEAAVAPAWVPLVLAGHTHCGQVVLPFVGALATGSDYGKRYVCGLVREGSRLTIVTAGIGTSKMPIRFGAPPDMWLITIRSLPASR